MHKTRLQELCHKRMWSLPAYTNSRDGPDHNPSFTASVVVNGQTFDALNLSKSLKEAHNKAAEVALDHLLAIPSASTSAAPALDHPAGDVPPPATKAQISYKSQLQQYVQKRNIGELKYISVREGHAHLLRFKARVTIHGQTFESSQYFSTVREAEHSAARVALLSLPPEENHQDEPSFYKNLLQEFVQKDGLCLPIYNTQCDGESHMPIFTSTVVLDGKSFVGDTAKTKKQAEMNAAKVAWNHVNGQINAHSMKLTNGKAIDSLEKTEGSCQTAKGNDVCPAKLIQPAAGLSLKYQVKRDDSSFSFRNQLVGVKIMNQPNLNSVPMIKEDHQGKVDTNVLEQKKGVSVPISNVKIKEEKQANVSGKLEDNEGFTNTTYHEISTNASILMNEPDYDLLSSDLSNLVLDSSETSAKNRNSVVNNSHNSQIVKKNHDEMFCGIHVEQLNFSVLKPVFDGKMKQEESKDVSSEDHKIADSPSLLCNRVLVYPCKPDMILPVGATLMPFSDSAWVAVSLDFSEHEDNLPTLL